jgi:acetolactate synthase I/II/III large subunit
MTLKRGASLPASTARASAHAVSADSGADAIVRALAEAGTRLMFGVPGGGPNLEVVGAAAAAGLRFILAHGETAAMIMAATYADLTGTPGTVVVTRGPGLASAVNGIAHAALDRLPVVVIADTVAAADASRVSHQRIDQAALGRSVAKASITVGRRHPGEVAARIVRMTLAAPRGPVIANMDDSAPGPAEGPGPEDGAPEDGAPEDGAPEGNGRPPAAAGASGASLLASAMRAARRPVLLLGAGAIPRTAAIRATLADRGLPALHTYRARGIIPDSANEAAGLVTGGTMEWPLLSAADLIIGLGVDEAEMIPAPWDYAARTVLITEPEASRPGPAGSYRGYFTGAAELRMPLARAAQVLAEVLADGPGHDWPPGAGHAAKTDAAARLAAAAIAAPERLAPQQVVATVRACTPPETVATVDAGAHMLVAMPLWEVPEPHRLLVSSGLATMGYALPAAIAAALCAPQVPVVAFTGDGGLGMTLAEIETAARLSLRVIVIVFNDAALSLIKLKQKPAGHGGDEAVSYRPVSFAAAATAMGAAGAAVTTERDLATAVTAALRRPGPTVIDASVDPAGYLAVMDLSRGQAGRRPVPGISRALEVPCPLAPPGAALARRSVRSDHYRGEVQRRRRRHPARSVHDRRAGAGDEPGRPRPDL